MALDHELSELVIIFERERLMSKLASIYLCDNMASTPEHYGRHASLLRCKSNKGKVGDEVDMLGKSMLER